MAARKHRRPPDLGVVGRMLWDREADRAAAGGNLAALRTACRAADDDTPAGLDSAGLALWAELATRFDMIGRERAILIAACRQADANAHLEAVVEHDGVMAAGAAGQPRVSTAVTEVRNGRVALARLLGALALPTEDDKPETEATRRARHAANVRWNVHELNRRRRRGATA